ncbi:multimerin-2 isoform X2 [Perognathus longimembris pacificus]|uniref:multimerin-2 isoform X2 n=1 Tax=Perognathus longimembris pacificus TaxID=214514 RepID=UPI002018C402|nr:multimerin-2 isoform X2 [Perognathus longimembris pacificus]
MRSPLDTKMILMLLLGLGGPLSWGLSSAWAQDPGARFSDPHNPRSFGVSGEEAEDASRVPLGRYRVAHKPVYQVKQKVLTSTAWRCCPGFHGPDCQHHDPTMTPAPAEPSDGLHQPWDQLVDLELGHPTSELSGIEEQQKQQEHLLGDLQNDIHQAADGLQGLWSALASNLTAATMEMNQTEFEFPGGSVEHMLPSHMDHYLETHLSPIWKSLNDSLHSLVRAVRNLSLDVEANRQAIKRVQEDMVARADFQELGAKFEMKVQENSQRVGWLEQDMAERLHTQHQSLHHALSEVQAEVDTKLKRLIKAQEVLGMNGSLVMASSGAAARSEPDSLQARLSQLQRNLSAVHEAASHREEELQDALRDMRATLAQHVDEIKELYSESDETFDQISKVERQVQELQVNHTGLRELRVILMEKSLIMEENKEELERQLLELNLTLQHLQGGHADLIKYVKDCNCQKLYYDLDAIREGQRDATRVLEETQVSLDERRQLDGSSLQALRGALDALSREMDSHKEEGQWARAERARIRSQLRTLEGVVGVLRAFANDTRRQMRQLHSSFAALLEDALRHEAVLAALFGEEVMEKMSEETPGWLPLRYEEIRNALQDAASGLQEQALGWDELAARVTALEQAMGGQVEPPRLAEHLEPSHDAGPEEAGAAVLDELEQEVQRLRSDVKLLGRCCEAPWASSSNGSLEALHSGLLATQQDLERHQRLFHSLFRNVQALVAANVSLDLGKVQALLSRKGKKQQKGLEASRKRDKKQAESLTDAQAKGQEQGALNAELWEAGSPVAFYASFSEGTAAPQTVKFNITAINTGGSYFPEHGHFQAPKRGVYLFAVSIGFGPGPGMGQLVFGGHHRTPVYSTEHSKESTVTTFTMAELQKGERVWFELTQGSVTKKSPPSTAFGGFLMFKT